VPLRDWGGWHQRSRSLDQPGRALIVSTFGETNDATCWPNSLESRSVLQQDQERSIRKRKKERKKDSEIQRRSRPKSVLPLVFGRIRKRGRRKVIS